jgi:hypothetical protein
MGVLNEKRCKKIASLDKNAQDVKVKEVCTYEPNIIIAIEIKAFGSNASKPE